MPFRYWVEMTATPPTEAGTATTGGARDHARSMAGTEAEAMPTVPPSAARDLPAGVDAAAVLHDEVVAGGGYTSLALPRGARLRLTDLRGDACAGLLLHRRDRPAERLNVADTVKVQWQAYLGTGSLLLSDMGRVLAAVVADTSGHHDTFCGTSTRAANERRYGDGAPDGPFPNGRDHFGVALLKHGLERRDVAPNVNLFKGVRVQPDGRLAFQGGAVRGAHVEIRAELPLLVSLVNVPHPLDPRPAYEATPLRVTAWRGEPAATDDPWRTASPEATRAYLNTEREVAA
jgi:urea carboxylase-associated protein 2